MDDVRGNLDVSAKDISVRAQAAEAALVQNVARFICAGDGYDPNLPVLTGATAPLRVGNGRQVILRDHVTEALMWMLYSDQARVAIAAVDMARENLADNGSAASGVPDAELTDA